MKHRGVLFYPWDAVGADGCSTDGFEDWADQSNLNALAVATSYHAGKFIRPAAKSGPRVVFPEDGTVYFQPDQSRYGSVKPKVSAFTEKVDVLEALCRSGRHIITGWTVLLHNTRLGFEHPDKTVRNAFGDPYPYSLCPSHPDNQHYAVNLCSDLGANYDLKGLSIETPGFLPFAHGFHHEFSQMRSNLWLDHHLGLCFCDHCRAGAAEAGVDADGLKRKIAAMIDDYLASTDNLSQSDASTRLANDRRTNSDLEAYINYRCETVSQLVARIRIELRADCELFVIPTTDRPTSQCWVEGSDLERLARVADGLEVPFYEPTVEAVLRDAAETRITVGQNARIRGILRPGQPDLNDPQDLTSAATGLSESGVEGVSFYNFGLLRPHHLEAIGQAAGAAKALKPAVQSGEIK
ncbi:MAG: hypothetical protein GKR97_14245 [Rhizobiaceae bacterium]|nr:hypothetical protein [Rhizobiaceae bacterium]